MTTHAPKVLTEYADAIMDGTKTFEIRKNDRGFKAGDETAFEVLANEGHDVRAAARHPLNGSVYRIGYILDGFDGPAQKYVAPAISKVDERLPVKSAARRLKSRETKPRPGATSCRTSACPAAGSPTASTWPSA